MCNITNDSILTCSFEFWQLLLSAFLEYTQLRVYMYYVLVFAICDARYTYIYEISHYSTRVGKGHRRWGNHIKNKSVSNSGSLYFRLSYFLFFHIDSNSLLGSPLVEVSENKIIHIDKNRIFKGEKIVNFSRNETK